VKLVVHVDGGSRGNPGPAAASAVVSTPDGQVLDEAAVQLGTTTNNVAEYRGLLLGLERARELGATEVEVVNDSELVAKQVNGEYKVKHADMKPLHAQAVEELRGFDRWTVRSVPRAQNAEADRLVNEALDGVRADPPPVAGVGPHGETPSAGGTDYATYLLIDDLLHLQRPITPDAHDEMLFIIVHQAYELWFKLIIHELTRVEHELAAGRPWAAAPSLKRVVRVWRVLLDQLDVLETMTPEGFLEFRDPLAPASGFQSRQFRMIESISGGSLWRAFCQAAGLPDDHDGQVAKLVELYRDHATPERAALHEVAERLLDHDEAVGRWRFHHVQMAAREIGTRPGTGGSPGVEYLLTTINSRFYDALWDVRTAL
jgi:tryptophan 2,3-dioxygenase/ribonuclease HI